MSTPADKVVAFSAIVTLASTSAAAILPTEMGGRGELPTPRLLIGTALTFTGLSILADVAPAIAKPLSAIIAISALTFYGIPIADKYFGGGLDVSKTGPGVTTHGTVQGQPVTVDTGDILGIHRKKKR